MSFFTKTNNKSYTSSNPHRMGGNDPIEKRYVQSLGDTVYSRSLKARMGSSFSAVIPSITTKREGNDDDLVVQGKRFESLGKFKDALDVYALLGTNIHSLENQERALSLKNALEEDLALLAQAVASKDTNLLKENVLSYLKNEHASLVNKPEAFFAKTYEIVKNLSRAKSPSIALRATQACVRLGLFQEYIAFGKKAEQDNCYKEAFDAYKKLMFLQHPLACHFFQNLFLRALNEVKANNFLTIENVIKSLIDVVSKQEVNVSPYLKGILSLSQSFCQGRNLACVPLLLAAICGFSEKNIFPEYVCSVLDFIKDIIFDQKQQIDASIKKSAIEAYLCVSLKHLKAHTQPLQLKRIGSPKTLLSEKLTLPSSSFVPTEEAKINNTFREAVFLRLYTCLEELEAHPKWNSFYGTFLSEILSLDPSVLFELTFPVSFAKKASNALTENFIPFLLRLNLQDFNEKTLLANASEFFQKALEVIKDKESNGLNEDILNKLTEIDCHLLPQFNKERASRPVEANC